MQLSPNLITDAAKKTGLPVDMLKRLINSGRINSAMLSTGTILVNANDIAQPLRREDTQEYQQVKHLAGMLISVRKAAIKYKVSSQTISQWVSDGLIRRITPHTERGKPVYIDEMDIAYCALIYHANPGQGKRIFNKSDGTPYRKVSS